LEADAVKTSVRKVSWVVGKRKREGRRREEEEREKGTWK
jgi:hypothetical protein